MYYHSTHLFVYIEKPWPQALSPQTSEIQPQPSPDKFKDQISPKGPGVDTKKHHPTSNNENKKILQCSLVPNAGLKCG